MPMQRAYQCPEHPDKTYTSWRKFRGHWSTLHRGEECPPREDFLQMVDKEERIEEKRERKEQQKEAAEERRELGETPGGFILPEDPVPRLAKILEVHGAPAEAIAQILGVFQIHPQYQNNPVNLHYLLTAKLNRKLHSSIPMIISAFQNQDSDYPEGGPMMMMGGMGGPQAMPPYMMGGGFSPYYPPSMGYQPMYRPPISGREISDEGEGRRRAKETSPVEDAVALLTTILKLKDQIAPEGGGGNTSVQEIFEGFRATIEEMNKESKDQVNALLSNIEKMEEGHKAALEGIKENLHEAEKGRLLDKIDNLERTKDDERTEGLGTLLREAGEGMGTQLEGVRTSITSGVDRIGEIVGKAVGSGGPPIFNTGQKTKVDNGPKSVAEVSQLLEAENDLEALAKSLEGGS